MRVPLVVVFAAFLGFVSCGGGSAGPPGSCKTGGTATGSFNSACTPCAQRSCDEPLKQKSGSGWASQHFGGDGACVAFNACLCECGADFNCAIACGVQLDAACNAAIQSAETCLQERCAAECR